MKRKIKRLLALTLFEWCLILLAFLLLPRVALLIGVIGYKRTRALMAYTITVRTSDIQQNELKVRKARITARMVSIASVYGLYRANCLRQSLLLWWLLAWQGVVSEIKFGTQKIPRESFSAHTWVEYNGETLSDSHEFRQQLLVFE